MAKASTGLSAEERAAVKERAKELKAAQDRASGEQAVAEKITEMPEADRVLAEKVSEIVAKVAPDLVPRTFYGMPAWSRDGKVVVFFKDAAKFKSRYATLGFEEAATLDDGEMWATSYALVGIGPDTEKQITALVERAIS
ncbi:iron chaperone [Microbacterium hominis]|uniref:DUF1801 domain-containing protein n=1 Tax=Microbacterium hominis TaxID=162426 RepID=A0A7D4QG20_9MICO|nr:hypothetical protein [Microbacterium hominis]QKJ18116.1 hypothetical protein HQM25_00925 [Microbacterium hominis]